MSENIDRLVLEVIAVHNINPELVEQAINIDTLEANASAYESLAGDLRQLRIYHYERDEPVDEDQSTPQESEDDVMSVINAEIQKDVDIFLKAEIEESLVRAGLVEKEAQLFLKPFFAALVESSLLKVVDEYNVKDTIRLEKTEELMKGLDNRSQLTRALDLIEKTCNGNPQDEWNQNSNPLFLEADDMKGMLEYFLELSEFRSTDRQALYDFVEKGESLFKQYRDNDIAVQQLEEGIDEIFVVLDEKYGDISGLQQLITEGTLKQSLSECKESVESVFEQEHNALLDQLTPIFESCVNTNGKFEGLVDKASEVEAAMGIHVDYLPRQVLGYEVEHDDHIAEQVGLGQMLAHGQIYKSITPEEVFVARTKTVSQNKRSCEKIDPNFESSPEFAGVMKAFKAVGEAMFEGYDMTALTQALQARLQAGAS
jgi:hypothetical protein